ncbi:MAG: hypothetical protein V3U98_04195 [Acidobacteriota bacterium]
MRPPRALWVEAPFGRTFGEPGDRERQRTLLLEAFEVLESVREPGLILHSQVPPVSPEHRKRQLQVERWDDLGSV